MRKVTCRQSCNGHALELKQIAGQIAVQLVSALCLLMAGMWKPEEVIRVVHGQLMKTEHQL
jgi:hypothetical protein